MAKLKTKKCKVTKHKRSLPSKKNWKTHAMVFDISSGVFGSIDTALLALDALRQEIKRLCKRYNCNCLFYGVVSISDEDGIKRTRYKSKRIDGAIERPPHIHTVLIVERQSAMQKDIRDYVCSTPAILAYREKTNRKGYYTDTIHKREEMINRLTYRVSQGFKVRTVQECTPEFIQKYAGDFIHAVEEKEKSMGGSKLVFPKYANMELKTDDSLFDFSKNSGTNRTVTKESEVWTSINEITTNDIEVWTGSDDISISPNIHENMPELQENAENQWISSIDLHTQKPIENDTIKCNEIIYYNNYIYNDNMLDKINSLLDKGIDNIDLSNAINQDTLSSITTT